MTVKKLFMIFLMLALFSRVMAYEFTVNKDSLQKNTVDYTADTVIVTNSTASKMEKRKSKKNLLKIKLKNSHSRTFLSGSFVFAQLETKVNFGLPGGILNVTIGLEDHLGMPRNSYFFSGAFLYRITPRSGFYANYYGFNRKKTEYTKRDIYWGGDTIPAGTSMEVFFNTQVLSVGYIFSILQDPKSYLGTYFNIYVMPIKLGVRSSTFERSLDYGIVAPLPNIGLVAMFILNKWLAIHGNMGFFSIYVDALGGYINDFKVALLFKATRWLNFNLNYQKFDVHVVFPTENIDTSVDYTFQGPAVGITLVF